MRIRNAARLEIRGIVLMGISEWHTGRMQFDARCALKGDKFLTVKLGTHDSEYLTSAHPEIAIFRNLCVRFGF